MRDTFDAKRPARSKLRRLEVIESDRASDTYTLVPSDADETERLRAWITVDASDIVDLRSHR